MTGTASKASGALHDWLITIAIVFIIFFGFTLSLICIFALPDHSVKPITGAIFFICSAIIIIVFLVLRWKKVTVGYKDGKESDILIVKETISDKILKWVVALYAFLFVLDDLTVALN